jgi:hypothetical protein
VNGFIPRRSRQHADKWTANVISEWGSPDLVCALAILSIYLKRRAVKAVAWGFAAGRLILDHCPVEFLLFSQARFRNRQHPALATYRHTMKPCSLADSTPAHIIVPALGWSFDSDWPIRPLSHPDLLGFGRVPRRNSCNTLARLCQSRRSNRVHRSTGAHRFLTGANSRSTAQHRAAAAATGMG